MKFFDQNEFVQAHKLTKRLNQNPSKQLLLLFPWLKNNRKPHVANWSIIAERSMIVT